MLPSVAIILAHAFILHMVSIIKIFHAIIYCIQLAKFGEDACMQGWDALVDYSKVTRLMLPTTPVLFKASPKSP